MKIFKSDDTFNVAGRGLIKTVKIPNPDRLMKPEGTPEVGETVEIDGELYEVRDVEAFIKLMYPPFRGENVALLVKPLRAKTNITYLV